MKRTTFKLIYYERLKKLINSLLIASSFFSLSTASKARLEYRINLSPFSQ
jgi:hypothetical protein